MMCCHSSPPIFFPSLLVGIIIRTKRKLMKGKGIFLRHLMYVIFLFYTKLFSSCYKFVYKHLQLLQSVFPQIFKVLVPIQINPFKKCLNVASETPVMVTKWLIFWPILSWYSLISSFSPNLSNPNFADVIMSKHVFN